MAHLERSRCALGEENARGLSPAHLTNIGDVIGHRIEYWRQERAWSEELIAREHELKEAM
jgi:hypothetical protein